MDFNLDDPLEDLLSDNASEDSFSNFLAKKPPSAQPDKSKVDTLFGIPGRSDPPGPAVAKPPPIAPIQSPTPIIKKTEPLAKTEPPISKTPPAKKEITFDDNDDIFSDLGFDPKKPKAANRKSTNILDDLLGISEARPPAKTAVLPAAAPRPATTASASSSRTVTEAVSRPPLSKQSTFDRNDVEKADDMAGARSSGYAPSLSRPRTATSSKRNSATDKINDPLGFFSSPAKQSDERRSEPRASAKSATSLDWLGLGNQQESEAPAAHPEKVASTVFSQPSQSTIYQQPSSNNLPLANIFKPNLSQTAQLFANVNADSDVAMQHLNQQESQLQVAQHMRQQEAALVDLQRRQQDMLQHQEQHFNALLQKQLQRQGVLDDNIRMQQERINSHLNMLMQQPTTASAAFEPNRGGSAVDTDMAGGSLDELIKGASAETMVELRVDNKRLQMENLRLSDLCEHTKENHEKELDLLETSHRKQMELVEANLTKLEARLRAENTSLEEFYGKKLDDMISEKVDLIKQHNERVERLVEDRAAVLEQLKTTHAQELVQIRSDHMSMIEHLR